MAQEHRTRRRAADPSSLGVLLAVLLLACGCGGKAADPSADVRPAEIDEALPAGSPFDVEKIDSTHIVIGHDVLVQLSLDVAADILTFERVGTGYRIAQIPEDSVLEELDFRAGDVVLEANDVQLSSVSMARRAYASARAEGSIGLTIERAGTQMTRTYVLRSALIDSLYVPYWYRLQSQRKPPESAIDKMIAALKTGVRERGPGKFDIDVEVLRIIAQTPGLRESSGRSARAIGNRCATRTLAISSRLVASDIRTKCSNKLSSIIQFEPPCAIEPMRWGFTAGRFWNDYFGRVHAVQERAT